MTAANKSIPGEPIQPRRIRRFEVATHYGALFLFWLCWLTAYAFFLGPPKAPVVFTPSLIAVTITGLTALIFWTITLITLMPWIRFSFVAKPLLDERLLLLRETGYSVGFRIFIVTALIELGVLYARRLFPLLSRIDLLTCFTMFNLVLAGTLPGLLIAWRHPDHELS
jgi:hypothetical protein